MVRGPSALAFPMLVTVAACGSIERADREVELVLVQVRDAWDAPIDDATVVAHDGIEVVDRASTDESGLALLTWHPGRSSFTASSDFFPAFPYWHPPSQHTTVTPSAGPDHVVIFLAGRRSLPPSRELTVHVSGVAASETVSVSVNGRCLATPRGPDPSLTFDLRYCEPGPSGTWVHARLASRVGFVTGIVGTGAAVVIDPAPASEVTVPVSFEPLEVEAEESLYVALTHEGRQFGSYSYSPIEEASSAEITLRDGGFADGAVVGRTVVLRPDSKQVFHHSISAPLGSEFRLRGDLPVPVADEVTLLEEDPSILWTVTSAGEASIAVARLSWLEPGIGGHGWTIVLPKDPELGVQRLDLLPEVFGGPDGGAAADVGVHIVYMLADDISSEADLGKIHRWSSDDDFERLWMRARNQYIAGSP